MNFSRNFGVVGTEGAGTKRSPRPLYKVTEMCERKVRRVEGVEVDSPEGPEGSGVRDGGERR